METPPIPLNETPAETFARAIAAAENDLDSSLDAMGRPDLKIKLRDFLRDVAEALKELETHGS